ncbi:unnamed protein product [Ixodes hexagonus]
MAVPSVPHLRTQPQILALDPHMSNFRTASTPDNRALLIARPPAGYGVAGKAGDEHEPDELNFKRFTHVANVQAPYDLNDLAHRLKHRASPRHEHDALVVPGQDRIDLCYRLPNCGANLRRAAEDKIRDGKRNP